MKLAIRTSSGPYAIGLFDKSTSLLVEKQADASISRQTTLGSLLEEGLREIDKTIEAVSEVIVDLGPGGLSSTRVGVSFANALSYGRRMELSGVSALRMQAHDARADCITRILSMRPAAGGRSIWALFDGGVSTASGCSTPDEAISQSLSLFEDITVVGPLKRLKFTSEDTGVRFINIESPSLEGMLALPRISPRLDGKTYILEPISSTGGEAQ